MYDLIIRDAEIFDGTGAASIRGDIAVEGDRIAAVGTVTGATRAQDPVELASLTRDEGLGLLDSVAEAIEIGERADVSVQIPHHKASGERTWGLVKTIARPHRSRPSERRQCPHRPIPLLGGQSA